jgi:glycosyltransferase involved in cell wall biosynthesis
MAGVREARIRKADILVNTDADLQYPSSEIANLVKPVIDNSADIVIGDRLSFRPPVFRPFKHWLSRFGTFIIRVLSQTNVKDAASGFRAFGRHFLDNLYLHGKFSYTLESLILAGVHKYRLVNIPIGINPPRRESRLFKSIPGYVCRSTITIIRSYLIYHPLMFFASIGSFFMTAALAIGIRFLFYYWTTGGAGHIQSLIFMAILALIGFQTVILGLIGDTVAANRRMIEDIKRSLEKKS